MTDVCLAGVDSFMVEYDSDDATCDYKEKMVPALDFHNAHWSLPQGCVDQFKGKNSRLLLLLLLLTRQRRWFCDIRSVVLCH